MSIILTILEGLLSLWGWFKGNKDQQIGRDEQLNSDLEATVKAQQGELKAANNRPDDKRLSDELLTGRF